MKKDSNKIIMKTNDSGLADHDSKDFEIFKSRVANAVLDYMEAQSDSDLIECLEKASIFLTNILLQMENVFDDQKQSFKDQKDVFDIAEDLFSINKQVSSSTIHWPYLITSQIHKSKSICLNCSALLRIYFVVILQQFEEVINVTNKILLKS